MNPLIDGLTGATERAASNVYLPEERMEAAVDSDASASAPGDAATRPRLQPVGGLARKIGRLVAALCSDPRFVRQAAAFSPATVVLSATDTNRELAIVLDGQGVRVHPYAGGSFDAKIRATERVHWAVLVGQMDPDAAFFAGEVRISGSLVTAFRVKNTFLSFVQQHLARGGV